MKYMDTSYNDEVVIQAELYLACKKAQLQCALEYTHENCRFDLVVVECNQVISIVEVKSPVFSSYPIERSAQIIKYKKYNIPVFILHSTYDICYLVKKLLEIREKFLESCDSDRIKCFEADRQNEEKWNGKISEALSKFGVVFPNYKFMYGYSLEDVAIGVKVLGLSNVLKLMDECVSGKILDFFKLLNQAVTCEKKEGSQIFDKRRDGEEICTLGEHHSKINKINEKLS